jgi:hypothetical protein
MRGDARLMNTFGVHAVKIETIHVVGSSDPCQHATAGSRATQGRLVPLTYLVSTRPHQSQAR